jgi:4-diphosphocytidyl-2C-methyl-D-erythritol kinase
VNFWSDLMELCNFDKPQTLFAHAKLNLRLKVLGRRPDGYHLLSMLNVLSTLRDIVTLQITEKNLISLEVVPLPNSLGPITIDAPAEHNLVVRAWRAFWSEFANSEPPFGVRIRLEKAIPVGAGLGGGSSDAGAVLRFLTRSFSVGIQERIKISTSEFDRRVMRVALSLGADVPYAYFGGIAWVSGVGEIVAPLNGFRGFKQRVLISIPRVSVATGELYSFFRDQYPEISLFSAEAALGVDTALSALVDRGLDGAELVRLYPELICNDFEGSIICFRPEVGELLTLARESLPGVSSITGSGSAIFSIVTDSVDVLRYREVAAQLGAQVWDGWMGVCDVGE